MKILYILNSLTMTNGVSSVVMRYYEKFNHDEIKCDFVVHYELGRTKYYDQIENNGDRIFVFKKIGMKNIFQLKKMIDNFMREHHDYDIIHCHLPHISYLYLKNAKKYGIKKRIIHIHNPILSEKLIPAIRNKFLLNKAIKYSTDLFACSESTGLKIFKNKKFFIQKNAFDYEIFKFNAENRKSIREKIGLSNELLIGCVGRFTKQKNYIFALKCLKEYHNKYDRNVHLVFVGNGKEKEKYIKYIEKFNLLKNVTFVEPTIDVVKYYSAFDVFLMPSLFEGIGIVSLEAQVNGLPVIHSEFIPFETNIGNATVLSLKNIDDWCKAINNAKRVDNIVSDDYSIEKNFNLLLDQYKENI